MQRRTFIGGLAIAPAMSGLPFANLLAADMPRATLAIVDRDLADAIFMAEWFIHESVERHSFAGDPGRLWMETLEPELRRSPMTIAGVTSAATLFCLQFLTRDYGLELKSPAPVAPKAGLNGQPDLVDLRASEYQHTRAAITWLLAPKKG